MKTKVMYRVSENIPQNSTYRISVELRRDEGKLFNLLFEQSTIFWLHEHILGHVPMDLSSPDTLGKYTRLYPNMATIIKNHLEVGQNNFGFNVGLDMFKLC